MKNNDSLMDELDIEYKKEDLRFVVHSSKTICIIIVPELYNKNVLWGHRSCIYLSQLTNEICRVFMFCM